MAKFSWIMYSYMIYLSVLLLVNGASFIMDKPVQALGMFTRWWFVASVFLITYISEWSGILYEKQ